MARIYFDTNVFSNLKRNQLESHQKLNGLLELYKDRFSFWFSYAHIRDKRKDLTDHKFDDLRFMEDFVSDNYIAYHPLTKQSSFYLATPLMVFNDNPNNDLDGLLNFFDVKESDDTYMKSFKQDSKASFSKIPWPSVDLNASLMPEKHREIMNAILPFDSTNPTFADVIEKMSSFTRKIMSDAVLYKDIRKMANANSKNGYIDLEDDDFNKALKDTPIGKTFLEFVRDNVYAYKNSEKIPFYNYYLSAYNMLDLLSKTKDKVTPKNTADNLLTDGMHTWFGHFCDYFVSDDSTIRKKAKAIYKLFGISTKVVSIEQFIESIPEIVCEINEDWDWFIEKLIYDQQNAEKMGPYQLSGNTFYRFNQNSIYLEFFDVVLEIQLEDAVELVLLKSDTNELSEPSFNEQSQIIQRALFIFGSDDERKGEFDHHSYKENGTDNAERTWKIGELTFTLKHKDDLNKYGLSISIPRITAS